MKGFKGKYSSKQDPEVTILRKSKYDPTKSTPLKKNRTLKHKKKKNSIKKKIFLSPQLSYQIVNLPRSKEAMFILRKKVKKESPMKQTKNNEPETPMNKHKGGGRRRISTYSKETKSSSSKKRPKSSYSNSKKKVPQHSRTLSKIKIKIKNQFKNKNFLQLNKKNAKKARKRRKTKKTKFDLTLKKHIKNLKSKRRSKTYVNNEFPLFDIVGKYHSKTIQTPKINTLTMNGLHQQEEVEELKELISNLKKTNKKMKKKAKKMKTELKMFRKFGDLNELDKKEKELNSLQMELQNITSKFDDFKKCDSLKKINLLSNLIKENNSIDQRLNTLKVKLRNMETQTSPHLSNKLLNNVVKKSHFDIGTSPLFKKTIRNNFIGYKIETQTSPLVKHLLRKEGVKADPNEYEDIIKTLKMKCDDLKNTLLKRESELKFFTKNNISNLSEKNENLDVERNLFNEHNEYDEYNDEERDKSLLVPLEDEDLEGEGILREMQAFQKVKNEFIDSEYSVLKEQGETIKYLRHQSDVLRKKMLFDLREIEKQNKNNLSLSIGKSSEGNMNIEEIKFDAMNLKEVYEKLSSEIEGLKRKNDIFSDRYKEVKKERDDVLEKLVTRMEEKENLDRSILEIEKVEEIDVSLNESKEELKNERDAYVKENAVLRTTCNELENEMTSVKQMADYYRQKYVKFREDFSKLLDKERLLNEKEQINLRNRMIERIEMEKLLTPKKRKKLFLNSPILIKGAKKLLTKLANSPAMKKVRGKFNRSRNF